MALHPLPSWDSERTWETFVDGTFHQWIGDTEIQKSQPDLDRYADLIEVSQPDLIIETGTRAGGSALWFRDKGLRVVSIDVSPQSGLPPVDGIAWVTGDSVDAQVARWVVEAKIRHGMRVMVSLDSDHHVGHVIGEISTWARLVTPGCYLVIEDGCFDMWDEERAKVGGSSIATRGGPLKAINVSHPFLVASGFWRDEDLEGLHPVSHSPVGWWRKDA